MHYKTHLLLLTSDTRHRTFVEVWSQCIMNRCR